MTVGDPNSFLMGAGGKSAVFKNHDDQVWGRIVHFELRQQTDFDSGAPLVWDDGNPRMQLAVTLQTNDRDDDDDDGLRNIYVKGQMQKALAGAVVKAGATGIAEGGQVLVRYTSDAEPRRSGMSGAKQYFVKYEPPVYAIEDDGNGESLPHNEEPPIDEDDLPF